MSEKEFKFQWGVITFLDFLGWKGIWMNDYKRAAHHRDEGCSSRDGVDLRSLQELTDLIHQIQDLCKHETYSWSSCKFISISDTIVILSKCQDDNSKNYEALKKYSKICSNIMDMSANAGFALRGAITLGEYGNYENIIVGPGVDECASWCDKVNWLGVIFAPTAQFIIEKNIKNEEFKANIVKYENIPLKKDYSGIEYCVSWGMNDKILNGVLQNTPSLSPEIAIKYINTNKFLYTIRPTPEHEQCE